MILYCTHRLNTSRDILVLFLVEQAFLTAPEITSRSRVLATIPVPRTVLDVTEAMLHVANVYVERFVKKIAELSYATRMVVGKIIVTGLDVLQSSLHAEQRDLIQ